MESFNLKAYQYQRLLEERRGNNFSYPNEDEIKKLHDLGYIEENPTMSVEFAKEKVLEWRKKGHYARIICHAQGKIRMREYTVIHRPKKPKPCSPLK